MKVVTKNIAHYDAVIRAWRVARWANHAWGNLPDGALTEVWNLRPSFAGFVESLPGYSIARGWVHEGVMGYGNLAPTLVGDDWHGYGLRVWVGSHAQLRVDCYPEKTHVAYTHGIHWAEAGAEHTRDTVLVVICNGYQARPRDWARLARALVVAYDLRDSRGHDIMETLRNMLPTEEWAEFNTYFSLAGPDILVGPEGILAAI